MKRTKPAKRSEKARVDEILAALRAASDTKIRDEMGPRYGIVTPKAMGVRMAAMQKIAKPHAGDHALAAALWDAEWYEARMVASMVDDPAQVTPSQMDRWCRDFDNWAICDTVCFKLFDRVPHALAKVEAWAGRKPEFEKRAAFALLASVALHDKKLADDALRRFLPLCEEASADARNFVKKGVSWALRGMGHRGPALKRDCIALARRLAASEDAAPRWVGKDVLRDLCR
jgi:3-methyladenine DNA glycosylase AlkD